MDRKKDRKFDKIDKEMIKSHINWTWYQLKWLDID